MTPLFARYAEISPPARRFLIGAAMIELAHVFPWVLQNLYVRALGHDESTVGIVLATGAAGVLLSTFPSAWLYERLGPRRSLGLACVATGSALVALGLVSSVPWLGACALVNAAGHTLHVVVAAPFLTRVSTIRERTHLFGAEFAVHTLSMMLGAQLAGLIADTLRDAGGLPEVTALRAALVAGGSASFLGLLAYRRLPDALPDEDDDAAPAPCADTGGEVAREVPPEAPATAPSRTDPSAPLLAEPVAPAGAPVPAAGPRARLNPVTILAPRHWHLWWRVSIPQFLIGTGAGLVIPFLNLYFRDRFALSEGWIGTLMALSSLTMTVGVLFAPWVTARLGLVVATILSEAVSIPFFLVLAFTTSLPVACVAFVLRAAFMNLSQPLWRQLVMELTPSRWRHAVNSVNMFGWNVGWAVSALFGGVLIEKSRGLLGEGVDGYALPMLITLSLYVAAIVFERVLFWRHRHVGRVDVAGRPGAAPTRAVNPPGPRA